MKQTILLIFAIAAIAALLVPVSDMFVADAADDGQYEDIAASEEVGQTEVSEYDAIWGYAALFGVLILVGLLMFLEHLGKLKDPLLY